MSDELPPAPVATPTPAAVPRTNQSQRDAARLRAVIATNEASDVAARQQQAERPARSTLR